MSNPALFNPHLEGDSFYWEGGPIGALLVHGFTATTVEIRPFARFLHTKGFSVAGPLLAGHGTSPNHLNRTRWMDWVQSAEVAYQELQSRCEKVFVVGESAGAVVCLSLAIQHPEICMLILASPALKLNLKPKQIRNIRFFAPVLKSVSKGKMDSSIEWQGYMVNPLKGVLQLIEMGQTISQRLPAITQPIQIIQGRLDKAIDMSSAETILNSVCSQVKELVWMEASNHCVLLDREKEAVFEKGLAFINRNLAG